KIQTVIFDMDGVIIDSEPIHMKVEQEVFHELGINITEKDHQKFVGISGEEMIRNISGKYQLEVTAEEILKEMRSRYLKDIQENDSLVLVEGVYEIIRYLYNKKDLILASSATAE